MEQDNEDPNADAIRAGFVRQRRLLLGASVLLFFFHAGGIEVETITLLGNVFDLSRPAIIPISIGVLWLYAFARYTQYFLDLPGRPFRKMWDDQFTTTLRRYVLRKSIENLREKRKGVRQHGHADASPPQDGWVAGTYVGRGDIVYDTDAGGLGHTKFEEKIVVARGRIRWFWIWSWWLVNLRSHVGTEYVLPFLVALLPIVGWLVF